METAYSAVKNTNVASLVAFSHVALFSPALSTLTTALQCNYIPKFAGLTLHCLQLHPPQSIPMHKGHMDQACQNQQSTKTKPTDNATADSFPTQDPANMHSHFCYAAVLEPTGQIYTDQTGQFVTPSSTGNNYILVLYDYDSNAIIPIPFKNWHSDNILAAYKQGHAILCKAGL